MKLLEELKNKNINIYPIKQLVLTDEKNYNLDRIKSLNDLKNNLVYKSVLNNLLILESKKTKYKDLISEVIIWMDCAKCGTKEERKKWEKRGYNLFTHNLGSAEIYKEYTSNYDEIVYILIKTHGLIGQYIKGEVNLSTNKELYSLIEKKLISKKELKEILSILNECIISDVSIKIYEREKDEIDTIIDKIINNQFDEKIDIVKRIDRLNEGINNSEKDFLKEIIRNNEINSRLTNIFENIELWYYKSALKTFSVENQIKILLILSNYTDKISEITFAPLMENIYLNYKKVKMVNIYKQRIIEKYLNEITFNQIINNSINSNINISYSVKRINSTVKFNFIFSKVAKKLIEFCEVAYTSGALYNKSVLLLYDLFGFRKDDYDRFYNENEYLETMNSTINYKSVLLDYIVGEKVLDVGPGGGALMDLISETFDDKEVYGIDISSNVIDELNKKKINENKKYHLIKGNALNLEDYFDKNSLDTIIYSSIIHELFSYIKYDGKKFNYDVIKKTLTSAYNVLKVGGRIIIRDGIKTQSNEKRIIEFKNKDDINILKRYVKDFKGRTINYSQIDDNKVLMDINDSMEFLYTYTWGEESYSLEVQEQFGYYTPNEYEDMIYSLFNNCKIICSKAFLQDGYKIHLESKINYYDENYNTVDLPNSTYILVIEKESN